MIQAGNLSYSTLLWSSAGPLEGSSLGMYKSDAKRRPEKTFKAPSAVEDNQQGGVQWFSLKLAFMVFLIACDLGLNSSLECDEYHNSIDLQFIMFGVHLVVQITLFLTLFLLLCDTFLFQVGLLGVLFAHFRAVLILQPIYVVYTLMLDGYRISYLMKPGHMLKDLYLVSSFQLLAITHKLVAAFYYVVNLRAAMKLADPHFYRKEPWMQLYQQLLASQQHFGSTGDSARQRLLQQQLQQQQHSHNNGSGPAAGQNVRSQQAPLPAAAVEMTPAAGAGGQESRAKVVINEPASSRSKSLRDLVAQRASLV